MMEPTTTRADVLERITAAEEEIRGLGVQRLALFGSFARDEAGPDSDVDLLVELIAGRKSVDGFMQLYDVLEERLGGRVELVTTEALSPYIGPRFWPRRRTSFAPLDRRAGAAVAQETEARCREVWSP